MEEKILYYKMEYSMLIRVDDDDCPFLILAPDRAGRASLLY